MDQTTRLDVAGIIEDALDDLLCLLDRAHVCADVRALRTEAVRLRHAVDHWKLQGPGEAQLGAMHELLAQLTERAQRFARPASGIELSPRQRPTIPEIPAARAVHSYR